MASVSLKRILIIGAVIVSTTLVWLTAKPWLESPLRFSSYTILLWPSLALIVASAVTGLAWTMLERRWDRFGAAVASWASFVLCWGPDIWYLTMLPVFVWFWYLSAHRIRVDLADRHTMRITTSLGTGLTPLILGVFLLLSMGFYVLPSSQSVGVSDVSEGIQLQIERVYETPVVVSQLNQLPPAMRAQVKAELAKNIDRYAQRFLGPLSAYLPPLLAFGLFLVLWSVLFIYRELAIWSGSGLFKILKASGFVRVEEHDVKAQVLVL